METRINPETGLDLDRALGTIGDEPMVRDVLLEDSVFFNNGFQEIGGRSLEELPKVTIVTRRTPEFHEMTDQERNTELQNYWKECDKKTCKDLQDNSAAGPTESQASWEKRMGLKPMKNRDRRVPIDAYWPKYLMAEEGPDPSEVAWIFGRLYDKSLSSNKGYFSDVFWDDVEEPEMEEYDMHPKRKNISFDDVDVLEMSWPEQREFRYNHPDAYDDWVKRLKKEMGPWFDESLVLPTYLSPREDKVQKAIGFFQIWDEILESVKPTSNVCYSLTERESEKVKTLMDPETWANIPGVY